MEESKQEIRELQSLISDTVRGAMEDLIEDISAISSDEYLRSIEEARSDYKEDKVKPLEDVFDA